MFAMPAASAIAAAGSSRSPQENQTAGREDEFMAEFLDIVKTRRSIRKYEERDVAAEALSAILESVRWAPSWANTQCWEIVVVRDPAVKEQLQATLPPKGNPARGAVVQAPVVLALCGRLKSSGFYRDQVTTKFGDWFMFDLGIACQTICLTAHALKLGTVVVGLFDHAKAASVLKVPEGCELVAMIPLGYPAKISSAPNRREVAEFIHQDCF
jgi:nitroreductase